MSLHKSASSSSKLMARDRTRRGSAAEIDRVFDACGMAPLAEKALAIGEEIGKGKFKKVYTGLLRQQCGEAPRQVVVMQYKKQGSEVSELSVLALLAGQACSKAFVPHMFGVVDRPAMISVVQEQAAHGTLKSTLQSQGGASLFTPQHKLNAAINVVFALEYLHSLRIIHADLACRNLLLFHIDQDPGNICVKVTDFGLALVMAENCTSEIKKQPQATRWCSPETVAFNKYSFNSDMWSLGVSLWELFADGANPWECLEKRTEVTEMLKELSQHHDTTPSVNSISDYFPLPDTCSSDAREVIMSCLMLCDEARPNATDAAERLRMLLHVESALELSAVSQDDAESIISTEAPGGLNGCPSCELPVTMKLVASGKAQCTANPEQDHSQVSKLQALCDFLWSPYAQTNLGHATVQVMQQEVYEAQQALRIQPVSAPVSGQQDNAPLRELLLPLEHTQQGHARCWAASTPLSIWTLWSLIEGDVLHREDFGCEAAARAALQSKDVTSCVLRGPNNEEEVYTPCIQCRRP